MTDEGKGLRRGGKQRRYPGRLPPVVSPLFSIKAAHWRDAIEFGRDREGKSGGARRRVIRVKGSASRGEGSSTSMRGKVRTSLELRITH